MTPLASGAAGGNAASSRERGTLVVAVGGNALIVDPTKTSIADQYLAARATARHVATLIVDGWRVVLTHGNGPQVGFILRRSELAANEVAPVPMHYAGADLQGGLGFMLVTALEHELAAIGAHAPVASLITRVVVDPADPAFANPGKPIGSHMSEAQAQALAARYDWTVREDSGRGWRRVVPSPQPQSILDLDALRALIERGYTVVGCGGGGIPVRKDAEGAWDGVDAVIDKDLASSLLATELAADALVIVTGVPRVAINFGTPQQEELEAIDVATAERYAAEGHFGAGSMAPKVDAILRYVRATGRAGIITDAEHVPQAVAGTAGTRIVATEATTGSASADARASGRGQARE